LLVCGLFNSKSASDIKYIMYPAGIGLIVLKK